MPDGKCCVSVQPQAADEYSSFVFNEMGANLHRLEMNAFRAGGADRG